MAFVVFESKRGRVGRRKTLPNGVCSVHNSGKFLIIYISAPDAQNGLRTHNYAHVLWDAGANILGVRKADNPSGAVKLRRNDKANTIAVTIPADLTEELRAMAVKPGRYYFRDDPRHGFYTIDLNVPVPETAK